MVVSSYDVAIEGPNSDFNESELPTVYLYPAKERADENKIKYPKKGYDYQSVLAFL